ncbi:MAG: hypothetical protein JW891_16275, partial [Candidatus Lokiarchaeota archaeon]|nr:hypothetical protein [Candidatus Lokiarchaeota archaeon]
MGNPIKRSKKEEYLEYNAKLAWASVMKELYFPPLQEPRYLFDYSLKEGFYIDHQKGWTITLNLANTPLFIEDKDYINYFRAIMLHEVYHYQLIPYDGLTNAVLLKAASKHISQVLAPIIVNLFSDLVIDTKLRENHHQLIEWELNQTYNHVIRINNGIICEFSIFVFKIYEKLWKIELNIKPNEELDQLADKVSIIVLKDFDNELKWEIKISKIALLLKNLIDDTFIISKKNAS